MINVYLFIELLGAANPALAIDQLNALKMEECQFANVVKLSDEKLVAQLDCETSDAAEKAVFRHVSKVEGVVQTNLVAVVRPRSG